MSRPATERRIVTVLFADLVGFTSLSEGLDPEDVVAVQDAYFGAVRETVTRYGGRLEKFIGDAAMAVFGVPLARDDDAERAVRAAVALTGAVEALAGRLELEPGALRVRVGVNSGEVVASPEAAPDEAMVTGDAVNVAARLQSAAPPGEVLVGETTALAVAAAVELARAEPLELKGKAEPVRASRVTGLRAEPSRERALGSLRAPLLGRERELATLLDAFAASATAPGRLVLVAPPGVGKTRLVEELAGRVEGDVLRARLRPDVVAPYDAVAQLVSAALGGRPRSAAREALVAAGASAARAEAVLEELDALTTPTAGPVAERDLGGGREARFASWIEGLDALAGAQALWLVEDAHWAGPDLLAFLEAAAAAPSRLGRLVLATARPSLLAAAPEWCRDGRGVRTVELSPLAPADTEALVRALVGEALPVELVGRIAERSDGNPLFVEELLRTWVSVGTLVDDDGAWRLAESAAAVPLPPTVQAIYAAQLDDLPGPARGVARRASVAGRRFPVAALEPLGVDDGSQGLDVLRRRALVSGPHAEPVTGEAYAYRHALLRDAGYASLARAERAVLHARLAEWLAAGAGDRTDRVAELVGGHWADALAATPALAREVAPGVSRADAGRLAGEWLERGAEAALELSAHEAARSLLGRALDLTAEDALADEARRRRKLGEITAASAHMDEGAAELERALELARAAGDRSETARAAAALSWVLDQQVQFVPAARLAESVLAEIGEREDAETALLLVRRGTAVANASDDDAGPRADAERAAAIARALGDRRLEVEALSLLAEVSLGGIERWEELERAALEVRAWETAVDSLTTRALILAPDRAAAAAPLVARAVELAQARNLTEGLAWSEFTAVELGLVSGDWDGAVSAARRALDLGIANGYDRPVVRTWSAVLPIAAARGDVPLLTEAQTWFTERFREPESPSPYARVMLVARLTYVAAAGFPRPPTPAVEERLASFALGYSAPSWLAGLETVLAAWLDAGELDGAARALARMEASLQRPHVPELLQGAYALLRARLLAATGEGDAAAGTAAEAVERFRAASAPWWIAKAIRVRAEAGRASAAELAEESAIRRGLGID